MLFSFISLSFAEYGRLSTDDLQGSGGSFSMISYEGQNVLNMHIEKEFVFHEIGVGAGLNLVFPENKRPPGLSILEINYIQYDNGVWGMRFGPLSSETYGYGLIMDGYNSSPISTYSNMSSSGIKAYTKTFLPLGVYGMYTGTGLAGARLTYKLFNVIPDTPLVAGISYVGDSDGVIDSTGVRINQGAYGYSVDAGFKIVKPWMDAYIEYGELSNRANAIILGSKVDGGSMFDFRVEYRMLGKDFVPGFFNANYEIAPVNITANFPATTGYFMGAAVRLMPFGIVSVGYEHYSNRDAVIRCAVAFNEIKGVSGVVAYEQTLVKDSPQKVRGTFIYPLNAYTNLVTHYEQIGKSEASYTLAYNMKF